MISGILVINKSPGPTSHDIVDEVRKIVTPLSPSTNGVFRRKRLRIGHSGTLDPFAEGILIILIGKTTKLQSKFMEMPKTYVATLRLGAISDTYDKTGKIQDTPAVAPAVAGQAKYNNQTITKKQIQNILKQFIGEIKQTPPIYSAIKIKGKKAYELARKGIKPELKPRKVKIYNIELLEYTWPYLEIRVKCGKGTYVRSLANDIGKKLSCGAYLEKLVRIQIGRFDIDNSVRIDKLNEDNWQNYLICVQ